MIPPPANASKLRLQDFQTFSRSSTDNLDHVEPLTPDYYFFVSFSLLQWNVHQKDLLAFQHLL